MIVTKRRRSPRAVNYRGMGDALASSTIPRPDYELCNPLDLVCKNRNDAKGDAWEAAKVAADNAQHLQWCLTQPGYDPAGCYKTYGPGGTVAATANAGEPVQGFVPQSVLTAAQVQQQYAPVQVPAYVAPEKVAKSPETVKQIMTAAASNLALPSTTPAGQLIVTSSGVPTSSTTAAASPSFDFSAIPWWAWAGGAAVALFALGGGRGR